LLALCEGKRRKRKENLRCLTLKEREEETGTGNDAFHLCEKRMEKKKKSLNSKSYSGRNEKEERDWTKGKNHPIHSYTERKGRGEKGEFSVKSWRKEEREESLKKGTGLTLFCGEEGRKGAAVHLFRPQGKKRGRGGGGGCGGKGKFLNPDLERRKDRFEFVARKGRNGGGGKTRGGGEKIRLIDEKRRKRGKKRRG